MGIPMDALKAKILLAYDKNYTAPDGSVRSDNRFDCIKFGDFSLSCFDDFYFQNGYLELSSCTWRDGELRCDSFNGDFLGGMFWGGSFQGTFWGGHFYDGYFEGTWKAGDWTGGTIYDPEIKSDVYITCDPVQYQSEKDKHRAGFTTMYKLQRNFTTAFSAPDKQFYLNTYRNLFDYGRSIKLYTAFEERQIAFQLDRMERSE